MLDEKQDIIKSGAEPMACPRMPPQKDNHMFFVLLPSKTFFLVLLKD